MDKRIRVLLIEDHAGVRAGLRALLGLEPDLEVVGELDSAEASIREAGLFQPDVILMDLMPTGPLTINILRALHHSCPAARLLVLTNETDEATVQAALQAGVGGYLLKDSLNYRIVAAIRDVYQGLTVLHPVVARLIQRPSAP